MQRISNFILSGAVALGLMGVSAPAWAGAAQLGATASVRPASSALSPDASGSLIQVQGMGFSCAGKFCQRSDGKRMTRDQMKRNGGNGWQNDGWNNDWKPKHPKRWNNYRQPGIYLDLFVPGPRFIPRASARRTNATALHVDWCYDHYPRSYRPTDNSWKPKNGKRRQCNSPYL